MPNDFLIPYRKKDKWGFCSSADKKIVIPCKYLNASVFSSVPALKEKVAIVEDTALTGKYQFYINKNGDSAIKLKQKHLWVTVFETNSDDLCFAKVAVKKFSGIKIGMINEKAQYIAKCEYEDCGTLANGEQEREKMLPVERNQKWGVISTHNLRIFPFIFDHIHNFSKEGFAVCVFGLRVANDTAKRYNKGAIQVPETPCFGFIDRSGHIVNHDFFYKAAKTFSEGFAAVQKPMDKKGDETGRWGFINNEMEDATSFIYEDVRSFSNGMAAVKQNGKWGFINTENNFIIDPQFENAFSFSKPTINANVDLAAVQLNSMWGFIDKSGNIVTEFKYEKVHSFNNGIGAVCMNNKWGFIDTKGELIIACKYDWVAEKQNKTNIFSNNTSRLDKDFLFNDGLLIKVCLNNKMGFIDTSGNEYWEN